MSRQVPIGIMPKHIWETTVKEERLRSLLSAMERYEEENEPIPNEWNVECLNLTVELGLTGAEKIEFVLGSTIEQAVNQLLSYKQDGKLVYGRFNGVILYSDTVTMDDAYMQIIGGKP